MAQKKQIPNQQLKENMIAYFLENSKSIFTFALTVHATLPIRTASQGVSFFCPFSIGFRA